MPRSSKRTVEKVSTFDDFHKAVLSEKNPSIIVVRFHSPWCRACRSLEASYYGLAKRAPTVRFLDVEITEKDLKLYHGLGVPSVPFAHVYHADVGLVEEQRLLRPQLKQFHDKVQAYVQGFSSLLRQEGNDSDETWSTANPYPKGPS